jgi:tRNA(adenine34) deaminase
VTGEAAEDERFMGLALEEAERAGAADEVPIGAVLVREGSVLARGHNRSVASADPTAHAEILTLREAARLEGNYRLTGTTLYVTVEPCLMCVGALVAARVDRVVYGAAEPKFGAVRSLLDLDALALNHRFEAVAGVREGDCRSLLVRFFKARRERP